MTRLIAALGCALVLCPAFPADPANKEAAEFFEQRVRPVLAKHCFACHTGSRLGGLRMDSREDILKGGNNGPALVPGNPDQSLLVQAVRRTHERFKMPPTGQLAAEEVTSLERWVKAGAIWPESPAPPPSKSAQYVITPEQQAFWSFQPVKKPALPAVRNSAWAKSPVDRFVLAKLEAGGLRPARPASRRALLRRVAFGLTGLPPTADEIEAFEKDASPEAFAKVVDRLLASPHYGERWGRHWLDLARYADGQLGASRDTPYPNAFRYRDWVIGAFNQDLPYDLFVKAQIAADLLDRPDREKLLAGLGFQALGGRGDDQVDVTTRAFLALTAGCAQCHDHKYDPIPTRDYYSLLGVFRSSEPQEFPLAPESEVAAYQNHKRKIEQLEEAIDDFVRKRSEELSAILAGKTAQYLVAARQLQQGGPAPAHLDKQILERWVTYLKEPKKEHPFLRKWYELKSGEDVRAFASQFQDQLVSIFEEKREIDDRNYVKMGGAKGVRTELIRQYTNIESLEVDKYYLWRDMASEPFMRNGMLFRGGVYYYGLTNGMRRDFEVRGGEAPVVDDV
ncbi:MAG: DUF1549 domain-containing protein, partial [Acidobacteria bacterium]|nr:DUF1549 domain-containing protein [Acidobacteriota bacterium]